MITHIRCIFFRSEIQVFLFLLPRISQYRTLNCVALANVLCTDLAYFIAGLTPYTESITICIWPIKSAEMPYGHRHACILCRICGILPAIPMQTFGMNYNGKPVINVYFLQRANRLEKNILHKYKFFHQMFNDFIFSTKIIWRHQKSPTKLSLRQKSIWEETKLLHFSVCMTKSFQTIKWFQHFFELRNGSAYSHS